MRNAAPFFLLSVSTAVIALSIALREGEHATGPLPAIATAHLAQDAATQDAAALGAIATASIRAEDPARFTFRDFGDGAQ